MLFSVVMLAKVTNKSLDRALRILASKKRSSQRLSHEISKKSFLHSHSTNFCVSPCRQKCFSAFKSCVNVIGVGNYQGRVVVCNILILDARIAKRRTETTRTRTSISNYFLRGKLVENLLHNKLPTLDNFFSLLLYVKEARQKNIILNSHISAIVNEVLSIKEKAGVKTLTKRNAQRKLKNVGAS